MSVDAAVAAGAASQRVSEIQQMLATLEGRKTTAATGAMATANFGAALSVAQAPAAATPPSTAGGAVSGVPYANEINAAAAKYNLDPSLLAGLVQQESGFNPAARSPAGATGLTQLMPATARSLGVTDATDPVQALEGGAKYLRQMLDQFGGDKKLALAAYNAGPGAVTRFGGIPPYTETQNYVTKVLANAEKFAAAAAPATLPAAAATPVAPSAASPVDLSSSTSSGSGLGYPTT